MWVLGDCKVTLQNVYIFWGREQLDDKNRSRLIICCIASKSTEEETQFAERHEHQDIYRQVRQQSVLQTAVSQSDHPQSGRSH